MPDKDERMKPAIKLNHEGNLNQSFSVTFCGDEYGNLKN